MAVKTRDERIYRHYNRLKYKSRVCCEKHWRGVGEEIWMVMGRTWNMSIQELKSIVKEQKEKRHAAIQQPSRRNRSGRIRTQKSDG